LREQKRRFRRRAAEATSLTHAATG